MNRSTKNVTRRLERYAKGAAHAPQQVHETFEAMSGAWHGFRLNPYDGSVTLFRARDGIQRV